MRGLVAGVSLVSRHRRLQDHYTDKSLARLACMFGLIVAILCVSGLAFLADFGKSVYVSGKVVSAETMMPIQGALVYVHSGTSYEEEGLNEYARSDSQGNFKAKARGTASVRVWKPGFAIRGMNVGSVSDAPRRPIIVELRPLTSTNWVMEHDEFVELKYGSGFCLKLGKVVNGDSADADFVLMKDVNDETNAYINAPGEGGIVFQRWDEKVDFDNSPSAPLTGYERSQKLVRAQSGFYYSRTRDGKHYAKFRLLINLVESPDGSTHLGLNESRLIWAYQPDGTGNLEIAPSRKLSFPLEKFGINRESLPIQ